ncbi:MAG: UDP-N-acetylmuramoyl-tripeptide--D-alanyl-D-alanine ligase [Candidatus Promineifilaceae bacterium]
MQSLGFILETLTEYIPTGKEPAISSVVIDSRQAEKGSLFVAFSGDQVDGHEYAADAFKRGAWAVLVERPVSDEICTIDAKLPASEIQLPDNPVETPFCILVDSTLEALQLLGRAWRERFSNLRVVGITGSVGKTTTKELTHAVLSQRYRTLKSEGNYNNEIGLPLSLLRIRPWHEYAVLEMGMYTKGEISLLADLAQPQIGVVTLVGSVHMEWLGSIEAIAKAKQELVEVLPPDPEGTAILNMDDPLVMRMAEHTKAKVFTYGLNPDADLWADDIDSMGLDGISFDLHHKKVQLNVHVPLLGRHSVHTSLRAAAVGLAAKMTWDEIVPGLRGLTSQLRLVAVPGPRGSVILDDTYNSSPESAIAALNLLADLPGRRIAVLGDMLELGPVEDSSHRLVGRRCRGVADILVAVGKRGRVIGEEAILAGMPASHVYLVDDTDGATDILEDVIEPDDMVLVKGSHGARMDRIVSKLGEG